MIRDISISAIPKQEKHRDFNLQTHFVADLYLRFFTEVKCGNFEKISIRLFNNKPSTKVFELDKVIMLDLEEDISSFFSMNDIERKFWILKKIYDSILFLSKTYPIDEKKIRQAYKKCLTLEVNNQYSHGEIQYSNGHSYSGLIICRHLSSSFIIEVHIFDQKGIKINCIQLVETAPYWTEFEEYLGEVKSNDEEIILYGRDKKRKIGCKFKNDE